MSAADRLTPSDNDHLDDELLALWLDGRLAPDQADRVESHLEGCDACAQRLEGDVAPPSDPFLQKLRGAAGLTAAVTATNVESASEPDAPEADANLMFGALAMQAGLITPQQLADACVLWSSRGGTPLAEVLIEQGWIDEPARQSVLTLLAARTKRSKGRASAETLAGRATGGVEMTETMSLTPLPGERLRLRHLHSQGGIGQVWRAQDTLLGREVALKELLPELRGSRRHRERFFREARVAAQLTHPGTAPVYEYREEGGRCYYTMRFYTGKTLTEAIDEAHSDVERSGETTFERLFPLLEHFLAVCGTIAYAHSQGIVHRDLKGENVVLGEFGEVTVIDWGLAKSIAGRPQVITPTRESDSHGPTIEGERLGTPGFMSPEQARGDLGAIDERTDVYGLAAMLYEVLTTRPPFSGATANEVMHRVETDPPTPPSQTHPDTPPELEAICLRGLAKEREDRYPSATALRDAVRGWLAQQAARQRDTDTRERFFSLSSDLFVALDAAGVISHVNQAWTNLLGWTEADSLGKTHRDLIHPDDHNRIGRIIERVLREGGSERDIHTRMKRSDGSYLPVVWTLTRQTDRPAAFAVGRPLDEESERQREMTARAQFFSLSPDLFVVSDEQWRASQVNEAWERLLGWKTEEVVGRDYSEYLHPDDVGPAARAGRRALLRGAVPDHEIRMRCRDGSYRTFAWTLCRVPGSRVNYAIGSDITEKKQAEERLRTLLEAGPEALAVVDSEGDVEFANEILCRLLGCQRDEIEGEPFGSFFIEEDRDRCHDHFARYATAPDAHALSGGQVFTAVKTDGQRRETRLRLSPLRLSEGALSILVAVLPTEGGAADRGV